MNILMPWVIVMGITSQVERKANFQFLILFPTMWRSGYGSIYAKTSYSKQNLG
jgi:hypothetical protein